MPGSKTNKYICSTEWRAKNSFSGEDIEVNISSEPLKASVDQTSNKIMIRLDINNITSRFDVGCELDLNHIARFGINVDYYQKPYLSLQLRDPFVTASLFHTGRVVVFGSKSVDEAKLASRRIARMVQKLKHRDVVFKNFRITLINCQIDFPFTLKHVDFAKNNKNAFYEPEINIGDSVQYRIDDPVKSRMTIFCTGKVNLTCNNIADINEVLDHILPRLYAYRKKNKRSVHPSKLKGPFKSKLLISKHINEKEIDPVPKSQAKETDNSAISHERISTTRNTRKNICYCESDDSPEKKSTKKHDAEEDKTELSEYELLRERRINERLKLLASLNIEEELFLLR